MKKILAGALALLASATMAFAEVSVGASGILSFAYSIVGDWNNRNNLERPRDTVMDGGFGLNARVGGALGSGNAKFLIGFRPEANFVFGRTDKSEVGKKTYNTLDIPLMLYLGSRINNFEFAFAGGPQISFPLGKAKTDLGDKAIGGFGIGGVAGLDLGYNITKNHGVTLGYRFGYGLFMGTDLLDPADTTTISAIYLDFANITLGYRYTF